jgi:hypothetical protein
MNTQAINTAAAHERVANELQSHTGCTRTAALVAASLAFDRCALTASVAALPEVIGRHGVCLVIRCTIDKGFIEHWSDHVQGRDRCDELNRGLDHPAYFIA